MFAGTTRSQMFACGATDLEFADAWDVVAEMAIDDLTEEDRKWASANSAGKKNRRRGSGWR